MSLTDHFDLQQEIEKLFVWSAAIKNNFNPAKCKALAVITNQRNILLNSIICFSPF